MIIFVVYKKIIRVIFWMGLTIVGFLLSQYNPIITTNSYREKLIAIVIDDFGGYAAGIKDMMSLPYPMTFAILPFAEFSRYQAEEAVKKGFEVIVHLPFESYEANRRWYGDKYISVNTSNQEIREIVNKSFEVLPMAPGLSNHMGSKATSDPRIIRIVFEELSKLNRFYYDSKTSFHSPALKLAKELTLPFISRDLFLDDIPDRRHVRKQIKRLTDCAEKNGIAVGIGHVGPFGPVLADILRDEVPKLEINGFKLVKLSELIYADSNNHSGERKFFIGIDPGHGGIDTGTKQGNILEKDLNLIFSKKLAGRLKNGGYSVILSRTQDNLLTPYCHYKYKNYPYKRDDLKLRLQKLETLNTSVIISIHSNWSNLPSRKGAVVFYANRFPITQTLADNIQEELNKATGIRKIAKPGDYFLLKQAKTPIIIIELGYLSNQTECKSLQNNAYQERLISAIIRGLKNTTFQSF